MGEPLQTQRDPRSVSTLLEFREVHRHEWAPQELRDMLRHQFDAPLQLGLGTLSAEVAHRLRESQPPLDPLMTLGQLLHHPRPPVELLRLVKRFAKMCRSDRANPLPSELVMLLYYASISAALARLDEPISDLPPASLRRGLTWLSDQSWVEQDVKSLLLDGLSRLNRSGPVADAIARPRTGS